MFKFIVLDGVLTAIDQKTNEHKLFVCEGTNHPYLLFTDGTMVSFHLEVGNLTVFRTGPCYITHGPKELFYGKTHLDFLMAASPDTLGEYAWPL